MHVHVRVGSSGFSQGMLGSLPLTCRHLGGDKEEEERDGRSGVTGRSQTLESEPTAPQADEGETVPANRRVAEMTREGKETELQGLRGGRKGE